MTAKEAIRKNCIDCVGGATQQIPSCNARIPQPGKVSKCDTKGCNLWPYRMGGKFDSSRGDKHVSRIKAIKAECLNCFGNNHNYVTECKSKDCLLYPFRKGKNPNRAGLGRKNTAFGKK